MNSKQFRFRIILFLFLISLLTAFVNNSIAHAAMRTVHGTVAKVSDGDTVQIITPEYTKLKVRLNQA
jgi:endonuclease YncB( thermonuclease family)